MASRISSTRLRAPETVVHPWPAPQKQDRGVISSDPAEVARAQDKLRREIGLLDGPVRDLIDEGRS
jgi:hypothetical protein